MNTPLTAREIVARHVLLTLPESFHARRRVLEAAAKITRGTETSAEALYLLRLLDQHDLAQRELPLKWGKENQ